MQKDKKHLPLFGVGPIYVLTCLLCTGVGLILKRMGCLKAGNIEGLHILFVVLSVFFIGSGFCLWIRAVLFQKIDDEIKEGKMVTTGVYRIVRNPIYTAFLFLFTGILLLVENYFLLILPGIYWLFLTILMKQTEEKWLLEKFGDAYRIYCHKVNRVIPWFSKR